LTFDGLHVYGVISQRIEIFMFRFNNDFMY
jgi:hypothetical protein